MHLALIQLPQALEVLGKIEQLFRRFNIPERAPVITMAAADDVSIDHVFTHSGMELMWGVSLDFEEEEEGMSYAVSIISLCSQAAPGILIAEVVYAPASDWEVRLGQECDVSDSIHFQDLPHGEVSEEDAFRALARMAEYLMRPRN